MILENCGDGVNQGLLVLSNDLKFNSRPLAYFTRRKTRSRQFKFTVTSTRDVEEGDNPQFQNTRTDGQSGDPGSTSTFLI